MGVTAEELNSRVVCVVLTVGARADVIEAVRSLLEQDERAEIVVVNSGGGDARALFARHGIDVKVVEFEQRLLPGAARNAGIRASTAAFVAFLAGDSLAEEGWIRTRRELHDAGHRAVATAVTNSDSRSLSAWTSYVSLYSRRMPGVPAGEALRYGASYDRRLFDEFGLFREDLRGGEDTEFHERIAAATEIVWEPRVRTALRHPSTPAALLHDHYRRGKRSAAAWTRLRRYGALHVAVNAWRRMVPDYLRARRAADPDSRPWITATILLLPLATLAYSLGAIAFGVSRRGGDEE